jgi:hypothetical protein
MFAKPVPARSGAYIDRKRFFPMLLLSEQSIFACVAEALCGGVGQHGVGKK